MASGIQWFFSLCNLNEYNENKKKWTTLEWKNFDGLQDQSLF